MDLCCHYYANFALAPKNLVCTMSAHPPSYLLKALSLTLLPQLNNLTLACVHQYNKWCRWVHERINGECNVVWCKKLKPKSKKVSQGKQSPHPALRAFIVHWHKSPSCCQCYWWKQATPALQCLQTRPATPTSWKRKPGAMGHHTTPLRPQSSIGSLSPKERINNETY